MNIYQKYFNKQTTGSSCWDFKLSPPLLRASLKHSLPVFEENKVLYKVINLTEKQILERFDSCGFDGRDECRNCADYILRSFMKRSD